MRRCRRASSKTPGGQFKRKRENASQSPGHCQGRQAKKGRRAVASAPQKKCEISRDCVVLTEYGLDVPNATARQRAGAALTAKVSFRTGASWTSLGAESGRPLCAPHLANRLTVRHMISLEVWCGRGCGRPPRRSSGSHPGGRPRKPLDSSRTSREQRVARMRPSDNDSLRRSRF